MTHRIYLCSHQTIFYCFVLERLHHVGSLRKMIYMHDDVGDTYSTCLISSGKDGQTSISPPYKKGKNGIKYVKINLLVILCLLLIMYLEIPGALVEFCMCILTKRVWSAVLRSKLNQTYLTDLSINSVCWLKMKFELSTYRCFDV